MSDKPQDPIAVLVDRANKYLNLQVLFVIHRLHLLLCVSSIVPGTKVREFRNALPLQFARSYLVNSILSFGNSCKSFIYVYPIFLKALDTVLIITLEIRCICFKYLCTTMFTLHDILANCSESSKFALLKADVCVLEILNFF